MRELKSCPFCNSKAEVYQCTRGKSNEVYTAEFKCGCKKCNIWFYGSSTFSLVDGMPILEVDGYKNAIEAWNRRANND